MTRESLRLTGEFVQQLSVHCGFLILRSNMFSNIIQMRNCNKSIVPGMKLIFKLSWLFWPVHLQNKSRPVISSLPAALGYVPVSNTSFCFRYDPRAIPN